MFTVVLCCCSLLSAKDSADVSDKVLESYFETRQESESGEGEELDISELATELQGLAYRPLNLNRATEADLHRLGFLNDAQIESIVRYRSDYGSFTDISEMQYVALLDEKTITRLQPFVCIGDPPDPPIYMRDVVKYGKQQILMRYQQVMSQRKGYFTDTNGARPYAGGAPAWMARYQFNYKNRIRAGFAMEKDAGEKSIDMFSAYISLRDFKRIKQVVLGSFQLQFGQGTGLWTGMTFDASVDGTGFNRGAVGIKPFGSCTEYGYLSGFATTLEITKPFELTLFYSYRKIDGTPAETDDSGNVLSVASLSESGYHRTETELAKRKNLVQQLYGGHLNYRLTRWELGLTAMHSWLSVPVVLEKKLYNQFTEPRRYQTLFASDYRYLAKGFRFFGEVSLLNSGAWSTVQGISLVPHKQLSLQAKYSFATVDFNHPLAGNSSGHQLSVAVQFAISSKTTLWAMSNLIRKPWLSYRLDAPSYANSQQLRLNYRLSSRCNLYAVWRVQKSMLNAAEAETMHIIDDNTKHNLRFHIENKFGNWTLKNRLEWNGYIRGSEQTKGFMIYQDVIYQFEKMPLSINLRYALFKTDNYDNRIYAYESDVLYCLTSVAYYDEGSRFYLLLKYDFNRTLSLWLRFSDMYFANKQTVGSGNDEIQGPHKPEIKMEMRVKF